MIKTDRGLQDLPDLCTFHSLQVKVFWNYILSKSKYKWDKQTKLLFPDLFLVLITVTWFTEVKTENNPEISHLFCLQRNSSTERGFTEGPDTMGEGLREKTEFIKWFIWYNINKNFMVVPMGTLVLPYKQVQLESLPFDFFVISLPAKPLNVFFAVSLLWVALFLKYLNSFIKCFNCGPLHLNFLCEERVHHLFMQEWGNTQCKTQLCSLKLTDMNFPHPQVKTWLIS